MSTINGPLSECYCNSNGSCGTGGGSGSVLNGSVNSIAASKVAYLEQRFECSICLSCLKEPVLTSCGHRFCHGCIHSWFKKTGTNCPIDGKVLSPEHDLFPDNYTRREISQQVTECPFTGCSLKQVALLDIEQHIAQSHENNNTSTQNEAQMNGDIVVCPFKAFGCNHVFASKAEVFAHSQVYLQHHLQLVAKEHSRLLSRLDNTKRGSSSGGALGGAHCSQLTLNDGKADEAELWTPPSKNSSPYASFNTEEPPPGQMLIKKMYERIVLLEQSNHELEIKLNNAKLKMDSMGLENAALKTDLALRMCQGVYIWRIPNFTTKISEMTKDTSVMYYSQGFYTSFSGYRFCGRVNLSATDPKWLSVVVHMMRGDNDDALSWPFSGRLVVTLVNPRRGAKSLRDVSCSPPGLDAFKRPLKTMNMRAFGYLNFITTAELHSDGYLDHDDTLVIKFEITCV